MDLSLQSVHAMSKYFEENEQINARRKQDHQKIKSRQMYGHKGNSLCLVLDI